MVIVKLHNNRMGAGPATVLATKQTLADYRTFGVDRDGVRDAALRIWEGDFEVGTIVYLNSDCD